MTRERANPTPGGTRDDEGAGKPHPRGGEGRRGSGIHHPHWAIEQVCAHVLANAALKHRPVKALQIKEKYESKQKTAK
jgi:hypothetical protein